MRRLFTALLLAAALPLASLSLVAAPVAAQSTYTNKPPTVAPWSVCYAGTVHVIVSVTSNANVAQAVGVTDLRLNQSRSVTIKPGTSTVVIFDSGVRALYPGYVRATYHPAGVWVVSSPYLVVSVGGSNC